ncbi:MAG: methylated-DNA--[protein]-cysteine S-methyltransferase [Phocaeicola sp.]
MMNKEGNWAVYPLLVGDMAIRQEGEFITAIQWANSLELDLHARTPLTDQVAEQLEEYLLGKRTHFSFPFLGKGTVFQKLVWNELCKIPYGETRSYKEIAAAIGMPKACRAVGAANHRNPLLIVIPCHRVIGASGKLTGYAAGMGLKQLLLEIEQGVK